MKRKRRTAEEKLAFIQEAESEGVVATCRRYGIYASAYYQCLSAIHRQEGVKGTVDGGYEQEHLLLQS